MRRSSQEGACPGLFLASGEHGMTLCAPVDLVVRGAPCEILSCEGLRRGLVGARRSPDLVYTKPVALRPRPHEVRRQAERQSVGFSPVSPGPMTSAHLVRATSAPARLCGARLHVQGTGRAWSRCFTCVAREGEPRSGACPVGRAYSRASPGWVCLYAPHVGGVCHYAPHVGGGVSE